MITFNASANTKADVVAEKTAIALGFESPRRAVHIKIRFKKGVSHTSWCSKSSIDDVRALADLLIKGYRIKKGRAKGVSVPARPIFDNYMANYGNEVIYIVEKAFTTYRKWSVKDRARKAGENIMKHLQEKTYNGSIGLAANQGKYAARKAAKYGDAPFVATRDLLHNLEVVVE